jgi:protein CWC15
MTTNHRPTLESKRGKAEGVRDTISHKRNLPQQTTLKFRKDTKYNVSRTDIDDLKYELLKQEGNVIPKEEHQQSNKRRLVYDDDLHKRLKTDVDQLGVDGDGAGDGEVSHANEVYSENDSSEVDEENSGLGSEVEDEDETAQLLQELNKIKQERKLQQQKLDQENLVESAKVANPLVPLDSSAPSMNNWRKSTAFSRRDPPNDNQDSKYIPKISESDYHKKFLSKHIR